MPELKVSLAITDLCCFKEILRISVVRLLGLVIFLSTFEFLCWGFCSWQVLVKEGKIEDIGLSVAGPADNRKAHAVRPITAYQLEWSLLTRDIEEEIVPLLHELRIGPVAYSRLGRGFLTGKTSNLGELRWFQLGGLDLAFFILFQYPAQTGTRSLNWLIFLLSEYRMAILWARRRGLLESFFSLLCARLMLILSP